MQIFIDLDTLSLIAGPADRRNVTRIEGKRGDHTPMEVRFVRAGELVRLAASTVLTFAAKANGQYDSTPVVLEDGFLQSALPPSLAPDTDPHWTGAPSLNTVALDALFLIDNNPANDTARVDLMCEFTWQADGDAGPTTARTVEFRVHNDVYRGDEASPENLPSPEDFISARAVRYDEAQTLTLDQQQQARENIGAVIFLSSAPVSNVFASVTLDPGGASNSIAFTSKTLGTAGNALRVGLAVDTTTDQVSLRAVQTGNDILITSGIRNLYFFTFEDGPYFELSYDQPINGFPSWQFVRQISGSEIVAEASLYAVAVFNSGTEARWRVAFIYDGDEWVYETVETYPWPDVLQSDPGSYPEVVYEQIEGPYPMVLSDWGSNQATAADVIEFINDSANLPLIAAASGASTGLIDTVALTSLSGGVDGTPGRAGGIGIVNSSSAYLCVSPNAWFGPLAPQS